MRLARFAVHHPIFTTMIALMVVILGGVSLVSLPIDLMPDITYPTITVSTTYEDATPQEVEELITKPIEDAVSAVAGVEEITSDSAEGQSQVRVSFTWGTDLDAATADIRDRLDRVLAHLPDDADRPSVRKFDVARFPIVICGVSTRIDLLQARELIEDQVAYRLERIPGVASVDVRGGLEREIHVELDHDRVKALGLSLAKVIAAIRAGNVNTPAGNIEVGSLDVRVRTPGTFTSIDELADTVLGYRDGAPICLRDLATVSDTVKDIDRIMRIDGELGIYIGIQKQSGANTVATANGVLKEIEKINLDIPQIRIVPMIDTSDYIRRAINNVGRSALFGSLLAVAVLLAFLRNVRSTFVIAVSIPLSIVATFVMIYFGGFTLNLMTLGGLALGIGMLVDNSIVVLENITRLRDTTHDAMSAAVEGAEEVNGAIIASTLTTMVVFLPLLFVKGMTGVMFRQFCYVVSFALFCSLISALSLVPMLASRMLERSMHHTDEAENWFGHLLRASGRGFEALELFYRDLLGWALRHRPTVLILAFGALVGVLFLAPYLGTEFMPETDEGEVRIDFEMEVGTRIEEVDRAMKLIDDIVAGAVPEMRARSASAGSSGWRSQGGHKGSFRIRVVPMRERERSSVDIALDLQRRLANIPGVKVRARAGQGFFLLRMGSSGDEKLGVDIRGYEFDAANELAAEVAALCEEVDGVTDTQLSRDAGTPERELHIDRRKAAALKLSVSEIAEAMRTIIAGSSAGDYRRGGDEYTILVRIRDADKMALEDVLDTAILNADGEPVVLRNVITHRHTAGPVIIQHKDQERVISVAANIANRDLGSVARDIQAKLRTLPLPPGFAIVISGDYEDQQESFRQLLGAFVLALIMVYMVMACQFESLRDPFVVMFSVPLAAVGVVLTLLITNTTFNIQSFIGCIMLAGIVVNNAILLVDQSTLLQRRDGMPLADAVREAGRRRLRPIMMTALTTALGLTPLAIGMGEGSEAQAPMARAVIGGLLSSSFITLLVIPVVYSIVEEIRHGRRQRAAARQV